MKKRPPVKRGRGFNYILIGDSPGTACPVKLSGLLPDDEYVATPGKGASLVSPEKVFRGLVLSPICDSPLYLNQENY